MGNRQKVENWVYEMIKQIDPTGINLKIYKEKVFGPMSDKDFHQYIQDLKSGKRHSVIYAPNYGPVKLDIRRNIAIGKKYGLNFFTRLWVEGKPGIPTHLSPVKAFVIPTRVKRQAQLVTKGVSVPKNMRTVNVLTGQPTGESQSAKMSMPELQLCASAGMVKSMEELMKWRGGDVRGGAALQAMLVRHGRASLNALKPFSSGVESTNYIGSLLTAAHIGSNIKSSQ